MTKINLYLQDQIEQKLKPIYQEKHPKSVCIVNYKGGVGKTTLSCLLGYYLASKSAKKILLIDIDPQCSLSLSLGFDPVSVTKTDQTIFDLVKPSKWTKISQTPFSEYVFPVKMRSAPQNLRVIRGSFDTDVLDYEIAKTLITDERKYKEQLFLYVKQLLMAYADYEYVLVDCPPNKMFSTQAMLRACKFYLPVTIPDRISIYGMPRLIRWVKDILEVERPYLPGYVLNFINRAGGRGGAGSQRSAESELTRNITGHFSELEKSVIGDTPCIGGLPRLDVIAQFLGGTAELSDFMRSTSNQPTVNACMTELTNTLIKRMEKFNAKN